MATTAKRLFLIDGTALAYRSHFAFATSRSGGLSTRSGRPTSAIYGFLTTLLSLMEREQPDAVVASFDGPRSELRRTKVYSGYKSTRDKMPEELGDQLPEIERIVQAYGIPVVRSREHEADDVIGTIAVAAKKLGREVMLVTADKDFMQIVDDQIRMWNLRSATGAPEIFGPAEVEKKFGVRPDQMVDLLALMGDSSDNIPGVPRVGQKTAADLLQQFGTLDEALNRTDEIKKPSIRKALQEHRESAELSRDLVTLHLEVPMDLDLEKLPPPKPEYDELAEIFRELDFDSLLARLPAAKTPDLEQDYRVIHDVEQFDELLTGIESSGGFAFDTETTSLSSRHADLVGVSFCWQEGLAYYLPFNLDPPLFGSTKSESVAEMLRRLAPLFANPDLPKTAQNAKYDIVVLQRAGLTVAGLAFDTMLASYLLSPGIGQHNLDALALRHFNYTKIPTKQLIGTGKKQRTFDQIDVDQVGRYAAEDADFTWRVRNKLEPSLEDTGLRSLFDSLELPLIPVLIAMEAEGIAIDREHLARVSKDMATRVESIEQRVFERARGEFNINSPAQVGKVLFEDLEVHRAAGITRPAKTRTGQFKTDAAILEKLAPHHEVPQLLLEYRQLTKLKSTYVDNLPEMVDPVTGRIHSSFNQAVAATGRLSSDGPNLQNIPIRTAEGREVRRAFVARSKDWVLLSADYSQIELRILAHMSGEPTLCRSFQADEDIHAKTAALVHGILPGMITPELRTQAKAINYGLMYGMGASRLARETGMTPPEAKKFIAAYFRALPKVKEFLDEILRRARDDREVETLFGRKRPLPDILSSSPMQRIAAENMAVNTPIQGTAADIIKRAMIDVHRRLADAQLDAKLLLQVHDELVLDVPESELEQVKALLRNAMTGAAQLDVPLSVSLGSGHSWLDAH